MYTMNYFRDMRYLYYENGSKTIDNIGSAKLIKNGSQCRVQIYLKKLPINYPIEAKILLEEDEEILFQKWFSIKEPNLQQSFSFEEPKINQNAEVLIHMGDGARVVERTEKERKVSAQSHREQEESIDNKELYKQVMKKEIQEQEEPLIQEENGSDDNREWKENEYYMSRISELKELSPDLEPLEHNSFLLHGYFNYKHLLIKKDGTMFRVGVPGNYYVREEMVASMFGFPNFEPAEAGHCNRQQGQFGYYFS